MSGVTLKQLEYLIAAAETGSVTAAAGRLYLSQSAVSTALADLEGALGVQVFIRHARGLSLTGVGQQVLADARRLLAGVDDLKNSARDASESLSGRLVVGCYSTLAPIMLPRIIDSFTEHHPGVDLSFVEGSQLQLEEQLRNGSLDLAILYGYDFNRPQFPRDFSSHVLAATPPYVVLPEHHKFSDNGALSLQQLAPEPLILFDLPPGGDYFLSFFEAEGLNPNIRFRTTSFEMVRALVARGLGYSILTQRTNINMSYEGRGFVTKPLAGAPPGLNVCAVHLSGVRLTRRATAFIDECRGSLG